MKKRMFALTIALIALLLSACAAQAPAQPEEYMMMDRAAAYGTGEMNKAAAEAPQMAPAPAAAMPEAAAADMVEGSGNELGANPLAQHKIIMNASITVETDDFDNILSHIEGKIASIGGYIEHSYRQGRQPEEWEPSGRTAQITARVPSNQFEVMISDVEGTGKVTSIERGSSDVTMEYFDNESRLSTLQIQLARLEDILTKSEKLADVLALETEIARIRYEIESLTTTQRRYDDLVQYSTLHISVYEVRNVSYAPPANDLGTRVSNSFISAVNGIVSFFEWLVVFLVGAFPVLVILGLIALVVLIIVRKSLKKYRSADAARLEPPAAKEREEKDVE